MGIGIKLEPGKDYERARSFCGKDYAEKYDRFIKQPNIIFHLNVALDFVKNIDKRDNPALHFNVRESNKPGVVGIIYASPLVGTEKEQSEKLEFIIAKSS